MKLLKYSILFLTLITVFSCSEDEDYDALNEAEIQAYLSNNDLTAEKTNTGLYYITTKEGSGVTPNSIANVTVDYKGYFLDGRVFDRSDSGGATFNLSNLIPGFREGMIYVKEGGEATLIIPSRLAYGTAGNSSVTGGSVILFDVKLISIN